MWAMLPSEDSFSLAGFSSARMPARAARPTISPQQRMCFMRGSLGVLLVADCLLTLQLVYQARPGVGKHRTLRRAGVSRWQPARPVRRSMLLTLTTTHRPATDLGFLLHKRPGQVQSFPLSFGSAHVFYPEAAEERCTAALLLDLDPVGLARQHQGPGGEGG